MEQSPSLRACLEIVTDLVAAESDEDVRQTIDRLKTMFSDVSPLSLIDEAPDVRDTLPWSVFLSHWLAQVHRTYGWLGDYLHATETTQGVRRVTSTEIRAWQRSGRVPVWAIRDLDRLVVRDRPSGSHAPARQQWSQEELDFLERAHLADVTVPDITLALLCSQQFGRPVNVPMVKHQLYRLRKLHRIPAKRPLVIEGLAKEVSDH